MLISHALPIWNGLLHRRTDRCAAKGHLNATGSFIRTGRVILTYFVVIIEQSLVVNVPRFSFRQFTIVSRPSPLLPISFRRGWRGGKRGWFRSRESRHVEIRWIVRIIADEHFSKRYIFEKYGGGGRGEPRVYGRLVKVWIDEPIKLRKITSSIWEPHRGRVNNELKINGITRLCVYW